jgi:hypothetical protein
VAGGGCLATLRYSSLTSIMRAWDQNNVQPVFFSRHIIGLIGSEGELCHAILSFATHQSTCAPLAHESFSKTDRMQPRVSMCSTDYS